MSSSSFSQVVRELRRICWERLEAARAGQGPALSPYDRERYDRIAEVLNWDQLGSTSDLAALMAIEAVGENGCAFTRSPADAQVFAAVRELAKRGVGQIRSISSDVTFSDVTRLYQTPKLAVSAIIDDGSCRILLIRRKDNGKWDLPAGMVDVGDASAATAEREALEEVNLVVHAKNHVGSANMLHRGALDEVVNQETIYYRCEVIGGYLEHNPNETLDARWFAFDELPSMSELVRKGEPWLELARRVLVERNFTPYFDSTPTPLLEFRRSAARGAERSDGSLGVVFPDLTGT